MDLKNWASSIGFYDTAPKTKRVMTYGPTGAGKTLFASTFPKPFFIDTDNGGLTLESHHIPSLGLERGTKIFDIIMDVMRKLKAKESPFDKMLVETLVFDSFTSLADALMVEAMKFPPPGLNSKDPNKSKPEWDHYAIVGSECKNIVKMSQELGINVVYICGTKLEKDDVKGSYVGEPNIIGGYRHLIGYDVDFVFYQVVEGQKDQKKYKLYTGPFSYFNAKARTSSKPLAYSYENPSFDGIWKE